MQLGAGTSLPGLISAKSGAKKVYLTDSARFPGALNNCHSSKDSLAENNLPVEIVELTWGEVGPTLLSLPPIDIILGSDCFYEPKGGSYFVICY